MIPFRLLFALVLAGGAATALAKSAAVINVEVEEALQQLYKARSGTKGVISRSAGMLVFPAVYKGGVGLGAEYGEGALLEDGRTSGYYNLVSGSLGLQLGGQRRAQIIVFMDPGALQRFKASDGWKAGVDGSVVMIELGASGKIDTQQLNQPILGFILGEQGLMYSASFEGAKITRLQK
jgi:lipid-binding SYLF domain-containing protein